MADNKRGDTPFVILDDESDMSFLSSHLIRTSYETGLDEHNVIVALRVLSGESFQRPAPAFRDTND